jgi:hypothetical protein
MSNYSSNQGHALLEKWPISYQSHSLIEDWPQVEPSRPKKTVRISDYSEVRIFHNRSYVSKKAYSKEDVNMFKAQVSLEATSIQNLISRFSLPTGSAIRSVLGPGLLKHENLVGLEHLVTPKARQDYVDERKSHSALVLRAQKLLREKRTDSEEVAAIMLAKAASISSLKSVKKGTLRAAMSLKAEKLDTEVNGRSRETVSRKDSSGSNSTKQSTESKELSQEKVPHFRVPSMDSIQLAHTARARARRTRAAFAA